MERLQITLQSDEASWDSTTPLNPNSEVGRRVALREELMA
jgi:hypothetical protein